METSPEFIVKVLDDLPMTTSVVAVNILPQNRERVEKIIVGGAMVPPRQVSNTEVLRDYTRFQPPTKGTEEHTNEGDGTKNKDMLSPKLDLPLNQAVYQSVLSNAERNLNRDESPPVGPQFLQRPGAPALPYSLIAPVAFTLHHPMPTTLTSASQEDSDIDPTRTSYEQEPTRTPPFIIDDLPDLRNVYSTAAPTRTTTTNNPMRSTIKSTSEMPFLDDNVYFLKSTEKRPIKFYEDDGFPKALEIDLKHNTDSDVESDIIAINDDYKDSGRQNFDGDINVHEQPTRDEIKKMLKELFTSAPDQSKPDQTKLDTPVTTENLQFIQDELENDASTPLKELKGVPSRGPDQKQSREKRRPICDLTNIRTVIDFKTPRTLPEIEATLQQWTNESPLVKMQDLTDGNLTTMENPIRVMIVDDPSSGQMVSEKQTVLIVAGIQGRDHLAVASAMFILYHLIEMSSSHSDLLRKYRFWIIPVFNPDGYDYTMTFPSKREWTKNLRQTWDVCPGRETCRHCESHGLRCAVSPCYGVNLDRNFEYQWIPPDELRAEHPCGKLYAGPRQLSELETQALKNFLYKQSLNVAVFIALKEGSVLGVMYPYSHTKKKRNFEQIYRNRATKAAASAFSVANRFYVAGQTSEFLPLYAGGIEDWADGHLGIDDTYTIMTSNTVDPASSKVRVEGPENGESNGGFDSSPEYIKPPPTPPLDPSSKVKIQDDPEKKQTPTRERPKWDNKTEFLMSCIATSVGLGNIWRFPFVAYQNGGGAFLIPYLIVLFLLGKPMYYLETYAGQFSSGNCVKIWALAPAMKGTGYAQALSAGYVLSYYVAILALCLYFFVMSFQSTLPWALCQPDWENCVPSGESVNLSSIDPDNRPTSSAEYYFQRTVLRITDGIEDGIGVPLWDLTLCLFVSWVIIFFIVARGVKSSGKAAYFLALFPYVVMFILLIRAVTLPGASTGILFFITPQWSKLTELSVWYAAITQLFFSLSVCSGALIMFSSYNNFSTNVYRDSMIVTTLDTFTSLISGITIFGVLGNLAFELGYDNVENVIGSGGTSLAFISYPDAIAKSPFVPQLFAVLFFLMMAVLGVGTGVALLSTINTVLLDSFPKIPIIVMAACSCVVGFLAGLVYVTPGGQYILELVDFYGGTFMRLFAAIIEIIGIIWIYGLENVCLDIEFMLGIKTSFYWRVCWGIITPAMMLLVFMYSLFTSEPYKYAGTYVYPDAAYLAGNMLQYVGMGMIPIFMIAALWKYRTKSVLETFKRAFSKKSTYGPSEPEKMSEWKALRVDAKYDRALKRKNWFHHIFLSLFGGYRRN